MSRFSHPGTVALVLAAGMGKRMNSDLAKVLHPMAGRPLLAHVVATLDELGVARKVVVIGHQREAVRAAFAGRADSSGRCRPSSAAPGTPAGWPRRRSPDSPVRCSSCAATRRCSPRRRCTPCSGAMRSRERP